MKEIRLYFIDDCPFFLPPILPTAYLPTYLPIYPMECTCVCRLLINCWLSTCLLFCEIILMFKFPVFLYIACNAYIIFFFLILLFTKVHLHSSLFILHSFVLIVIIILCIFIVRRMFHFKSRIFP